MLFFLRPSSSPRLSLPASPEARRPPMSPALPRRPAQRERERPPQRSLERENAASGISSPPGEVRDVSLERGCRLQRGERPPLQSPCPGGGRRERPLPRPCPPASRFSFRRGDRERERFSSQKREAGSRAPSSSRLLREQVRDERSREYEARGRGRRQRGEVEREAERDDRVGVACRAPEAPPARLECRSSSAVPRRLRQVGPSREAASPSRGGRGDALLLERRREIERK